MRTLSSSSAARGRSVDGVVGHRAAAGTALAAALAAGCAAGPPAPSGPPGTQEDYAAALLTYDELPRGFFATDATAFFAPRSAPDDPVPDDAVAAFQVPVGPAGGSPRCDQISPFGPRDAVATLTTLDVSAGTLLLQAVGPPSRSLDALRTGAAGCPESRVFFRDAPVEVLPEPDTGADDVLLLRVGDVERDFVLGLATVGPVRVGLFLVSYAEEPVDPGVVVTALAAAVTAARERLG